MFLILQCHIEQVEHSLRPYSDQSDANKNVSLPIYLKLVGLFRLWWCSHKGRWKQNKTKKNNHNLVALCCLQSNCKNMEDRLMPLWLTSKAIKFCIKVWNHLPLCILSFLKLKLGRNLNIHKCIMQKGHVVRDAWTWLGDTHATPFFIWVQSNYSKDKHISQNLSYRMTKLCVTWLHIFYLTCGYKVWSVPNKTLTVMGFEPMPL